MAGDKAAGSSDAEHRLGVMLVAGAAIAWSVSGIFARLIETDVATATCVRALFATLYMAIGHVAVHRGRSLEVLLRFGWVGLLVSVCAAVAMVSFVAAFYYTSVANIAVIYATTPFIAAALAWFILKERPGRRTLIASAIALFGVAIIVGGSFAGGSLFGDFLALMMSLSFAIVSVVVKRHPSLEMLSVNGFACLIAAAVTAPFATFSTLTLHDTTVLAAFAFTSTPLGFFMYLAGARRIPAAEAGLILTLEVALSPLWVYLLFNENPGGLALIGGVIVCSAVVWRILGELRLSR